MRSPEEILAEAFEAKGCHAYARSVREDARTDSSFPLNVAVAAIEQAQREAIEECIAVSDFIARIGRASPFWDSGQAKMFEDCSERMRALLPHREGQ